MRIAFVGCGAVGRPLGIAWRRAGHAIGAVVARTSADAAVREMGGGVPGGRVEEADAVVFATPDDALPAAAAAHRLRREQVALHVSGFHPSTVLAPTGARTASLHPLRPFADVARSVEALPGTFFFVEGEAAEVAEALARDAGGVPVRIRTDLKTLYHAGAAVASNYLVTLLAWACDLFCRAGVAEEVATRALVRLAQGALDNVAAAGIPKALTGPAARGDVAVVRAHAGALPEKERALYLALLEATIPLARGKGGLAPEAERALRALAGS
jgi:predicted short-subunit dehydrogenase-like oxidoreductase (DUF2520 family)